MLITLITVFMVITAKARKLKITKKVIVNWNKYSFYNAFFIVPYRFPVYTRKRIKQAALEPYSLFYLKGEKEELEGH